MQWVESETNGAKAFIATGKETGTKYEIKPGSGGKWNLYVDGNKVSGIRGTVAAMKKKAEETEAAGDIPETETEGEVIAETGPVTAGTEPVTIPLQPVKDKPAPTVEEWKDSAVVAGDGVKVEPGTTETADKGPGGDKTPPIPQTTPAEDELISRIGSHPANNGDPAETVWVDEVCKTTKDGLTLASLEKKGLIEMGESDDKLYCSLSDIGVARYDELVIEKNMTAPKAESKPTPVPVDQLTKAPPAIRLYPLSNLEPGDFFLSGPGGTSKGGKLIRKNASECKVQLFPGGTVQFVAPGTEVRKVTELEFFGGNAQPSIPVEKVHSDLRPLSDKPIPPPAKGPETVTDPNAPKKPRIVILTPEEAKARNEQRKAEAAKKEEEAAKVKAAGAVVSSDNRFGIPVVVREAKEAGGKQRVKIFGISVTSILRWFGSDAWTIDEAKAVLTKLGLNIGEQTISSQMYAGKNGNGSRGDVPELTMEQDKALNTLKNQIAEGKI